MPAGFDARDQVVVGLVLDPFPDPKKEDPLVTRFLRVAVTEEQLGEVSVKLSS